MNISLKYGRNIKNTKKYDLILKVAVLGSRNGFLFITFLNPDLIISVDEVQLGKSPYPAKLIKNFSNEWEQILVLYHEIIQASIIYTKAKTCI